MSINNKDQLHGLVIHRLLTELSVYIPNAFVRVELGSGGSSYILRVQTCVDGKAKIKAIGLYIKISNKRLSPWSYSFTKSHQDEIALLQKEFGQTFVVFVAGLDGVACLDFRELKEVLDEEHEEQEWVSISRKLNENYRVKGNDGTRDRPLAKNCYPLKVIEYLDTALT